MPEELGVSFERRNGGLWDDLGSQMQEALPRRDRLCRRRAYSDRTPPLPARGADRPSSIVGFTADELATITENFPVLEFAGCPADTYFQTLEDGPDVGGAGMWNFAIANLRPCPRPLRLTEATRLAEEDNDRMVNIHNLGRPSRLPEHWGQEQRPEMASGRCAAGSNGIGGARGSTHDH